MSNKPIQYKATTIKKLILALNFILGLINLLPISEKMRKSLASLLEPCIDDLKNGEAKKDSGNSHEPPSKDKAPRPKKNKEEGGEKRKKGGQKGHKGVTANRDAKPDEVKRLTPNCEKLDKDPNWRLEKTETRRVKDIQVSVKITDYIVETYVNLSTGEKVTGEFPEGVNASLQFGTEVKVAIGVFRDVDNMPYKKIAETINEIFGLDICEATVCNIIKELENSSVIKAFKEAAIENILESPTVNADETSMSVNGKNFWVHLLTTPLFTLLFLHAKRGKDAIEAWGLIPRLKGYLVHDCWRAYFSYSNIIHCLCNAHILRELKAAVEMGQTWANLLHEHLLDIKELTDCYGGVLPLHLQYWAEEWFRKIIDLGYELTGGKILPRPPGKRGRKAKPKYRNLLERLDTYEDAVLRFMTDKNIPFTNNDAERPVRQLKVRDKISGCFREENFGIGFCDMRGYLESCNKNGVSLGQAIRMLANDETPSFIQKKRG
jgi:transposase